MKVIFLSTFKFPDNDAGSLRYSFLSKLFSNKGYIPYFIGKGESSINFYTPGTYGFYTSLKSQNSSLISKAYDILVGFEKKLVKETKRIVKKGDIIVITCFFSKSTNKKIIHFADKINAKVLFAIEEKFSKSEFDRFNLISTVGFRKCKSFYRNIKYYKKPIIAISSYIGDYAKRANVPHIVIPFLYDEDLKVSLRRDLQNKLSFFYAGNPGKKDLLFEMIEGFDLLPMNYKKKIDVNIFGVDIRFASTWLPKDLFERIKDFIHFKGIIKREQIVNEISESTFSILLRNSDEEFAKAGFPTKIAETLFYGVPVIANISSDLSFYLKDRINSIIVEGKDKIAFCESLKIAINMSSKELIELRKNARKTSINSLTTKCFTKTFDDFLTELGWL